MFYDFNKIYCSTGKKCFIFLLKILDFHGTTLIIYQSKIDRLVMSKLSDGSP